MPEEKKVSRFGDHFGQQAFPEVKDRRSMEDVAGRDVLIMDYQERKGTVEDPKTGEMVESTFLVIKATDPDTGELFTFACGGGIVVERIVSAKDQNLLPLMGTFTRKKSKTGKYRYYDLT